MTVVLVLQAYLVGSRASTLPFRHLETEEKGLTIGGYESAWLADLAMSFLLDKMKQRPLNETKYFGVYRDDGIGVFEGEQTVLDITSWLDAFQANVNEVAGNDHLKFTAVIWNPIDADKYHNNNNASVGRVFILGPSKRRADALFGFDHTEIFEYG